MTAASRGRWVAFVRAALLAGTWMGLSACSQTTDDPSDAGLRSDSAANDADAPAGRIVALPMADPAVSPCEPGFAHPSVCCEPAPYQSPECVEDTDEPFRSCGQWLTFPDARTCCSLDDAKRCTTPSQTNAGGTTGMCDYPCGPGGFLPNDPLADSGSLMPNCTEAPAGFCVACCSGMFSESGSNPTVITPVVCSEIISSQGGPAICSEGNCPAGWKVPRGGQLDVCCRTGDGGAGECFSRANSIMSPPLKPPVFPTSQPVSISVLVGAVPPCPAGQEHPNVCCGSIVPGSTCNEYPDAPFLPCSPPTPGIVYPDPRTCCPLDGSGGCSAAPTGGNAGAGECYEPCGPGGSYFAEPDAGPNGQCCYGGGLSLGGPATPRVCPPSACDGGPCPAPQCGACPADWSAIGVSGFGVRPADVAAHELCCQAGDGGGPRCFSQADRIVAPASP